MSVPEIIDVATLLAPIADDKPAGESLKYEGVYDEIREARRQDDDLAQGEWARERKLADWDQVIAVGTDSFARTKDLQIAAWLAEGLVRVHGFVGLRDSLRLVAGLHEQYWDTMYPEVDDGDLEGRANAVSLMDRQAAEALKEVPLTKSPAGAYDFIRWEESKTFEIADGADGSEIRARAEKEGKITSDDFKKAKTGTRRAFYEDAISVLDECVVDYKRLDALMDEKFGRETPGLGELKIMLDKVRSVVDKIVKEKRALEAPDASAAAAEAAGEAGVDDGSGGVVYAVGGMPGTSGPIRSREDALRRLSEVAEFFVATEPHSPVSYLVKRAVTWGRMPLAEWLSKVIKDENVLGQLRETLGIEPDSSSSGY